MTRELSGDFPILRSLNNIHHLLELSSDFENDQLFCVDTLSTHQQFFLNYDTLCSLDTYGKALDDLFSTSAINDLRDKVVLKTLLLHHREPDIHFFTTFISSQFLDG